MTTEAPESRYVETNGVRIHYLAWDKAGPPLVIIHGNTHSGGVYAPLAARLAPDFRVFAVDLRGHGLSDKPDTYSWAAMRDDIIGLIDQLDLRDAVIVAHSRGGGVTLLTAAARPERVRGVVAYEPTLPAQLSQPAMSQEAAEERAISLVARAERRRSNFPSREEMYNHFHGRGAFKDWRDEYLHAFVEHAAIESEDGSFELASATRIEALLYRAMVDASAWQGISSKVPVLAVFGEHGGRLGPDRDPLAPIQALFPNTRMHVVPGATHSGPMEQPERFEALVRQFISSLG